MPQKTFVVYSLKHIGQNLRCDPRTAAGRIAKLGIEAFAISVTGETFYLRDTLDRLERAEVGEAEPQATTQEMTV